MSTETETTPETTENPTEPTAYTRCEQEHYQQIREKRRAVDKVKATADRQAEKAKAAKKAWEAALEELGELERRDLNLQMELPFGKDADTWRELPVTELDIDNMMVRKLADADPTITTIGKLSDYASEYDGFTGIAGIGPTGSEKLSDAFAQFWAEHPEFCEPAEPPETDAEAESPEADTEAA